MVNPAAVMTLCGVELAPCRYCGGEPRYVDEHYGDSQLFCPCRDDSDDEGRSPCVQRPAGQDRELALAWNEAMAPWPY